MYNKDVMEAVLTNNSNKLARLLERGIDANFNDPLGWTPIQWSTKLSFMRCTALLKGRGYKQQNYVMEIDKKWKNVEGYIEFLHSCGVSQDVVLEIMDPHM